MADYREACQVGLLFTLTTPSSSKTITAYDVWRLTETQLDQMYRFYQSKLTATQETGLIDRSTETKEMKEHRLRLAIIQDVFESKHQAAEQAKAKAETKAQLAELIELKQAKERQALAELSPAELEAKIQALQNRLN